MPARNDPVLDSGFPQVDHPGRPRGWLRSAFVWLVPLLFGVSALVSWRGEEDLTDLRAAFGLIALAIVSAGIWAWRTRSLSCPRCRRRLFRAGADSDCAYYPCSPCRVMWRSPTERLPKVDDLDFP